MPQNQETPISFFEWVKYMQALENMQAPYLHDTGFKRVYNLKYCHYEGIYRDVFQGNSDVYALRTSDKRIQVILDWLTPERIKVVRLKVKLGVVNGWN